MAEVDFHKFGDALSARLDELGYSLSHAEAKWPQTDRAMLSRATCGKTLSAGNYLLLCEMAGFDPYRFIKRVKRRRMTKEHVLKQAVTRRASRETEAPASGSMGCEK